MLLFIKEKSMQNKYIKLIIRWKDKLRQIINDSIIRKTYYKIKL